MPEIRWGLIGCGSVSRIRVARALQEAPHSHLRAACRRNLNELNAFCDSFGIERAYQQASELFADPEIDAVYIATPVCEHLPQTVAAAAAGKHVLVEKPMAMTVAECDEMIETCERAGVKLGVAYYRRFYPILHRIEELIKRAEIGTVIAASVVTASRAATQPEQEGFWRRVAAAGGGGPLMDIGSHRIDLLLHLLGQPAETSALCSRVEDAFEVEDSAVVLFRFENGAVGTLQCHFACPSDPDEFSILGTKGLLTAKPLNGDRLVVEFEGKQRVERHPPPANLCGPLVVDFVNSIRENRSPTVPGEEGRAVNRVIERAYTSAAGSR